MRSEGWSNSGRRTESDSIVTASAVQAPRTTSATLGLSFGWFSTKPSGSAPGEGGVGASGAVASVTMRTQGFEEWLASR